MLRLSQRRNFGLKSGGTILEGEGGALGAQGEGRMERKYLDVIRLLGEHRELFQRGPENGFIVI